MRVFDHPNMNEFTCPICNTSEDRPVVLIEINGRRRGNNAEAAQVHFDCLEPIIYLEERIIAQSY